MLDNLIDNAVKASAAGVGGGRPRDAHGRRGVEVHVIDQGPGLSDEERRHAFDRFWRSGATGRGGSGLGLAIVDRLATASGGTAELRPGAGGGVDAVITPAGAPAPRRRRSPRPGGAPLPPSSRQRSVTAGRRAGSGARQRSIAAPSAAGSRRRAAHRRRRPLGVRAVLAGVVVEGHRPGRGLVEDAPEAPDVGLRVHAPAARLLGRHVGGRPEAAAHPPRRTRDAEVDQRGPPGVDDDVRGLEVEVEDPLAVEVGDGRRELAPQPRHGGGRAAARALRGGSGPACRRAAARAPRPARAARSPRTRARGGGATGAAAGAPRPAGAGARRVAGAVRAQPLGDAAGAPGVAPDVVDVQRPARLMCSTTR